MRVLFVCTGNICRSPMAEAYFRHLCDADGLADIEVMSAGLCVFEGGQASDVALKVLEKENVVLDNFESSPVDESLLRDADAVVSMTNSHNLELKSLFPEDGNKFCTLLSYVNSEEDVSDPYGGDIAEYTACLEKMKPALHALLKHIKAEARI